MSQRIVSRLVGAGILAAALTFAGPVRAEARGFQDPSDVLQWLTQAWQSGVSQLWPWNQAPCTNPDGSACPDSSTAGAPGDQGFGADPNG